MTNKLYDDNINYIKQNVYIFLEYVLMYHIQKNKRMSNQ